jgi:hypothetical protein
VSRAVTMTVVREADARCIAGEVPEGRTASYRGLTSKISTFASYGGVGLQCSVGGTQKT